MDTKQTTEGRIVQCIGAVIDIQFPRDEMPRIYDALTLVEEGTSFAEKGLTNTPQRCANCRAVAKRAEGFEMTVLHTRETPLPTLLERSDFVSVHAPLTPETHHLIDAEALRLMRATAILINTARGPIVDQRALAEALENSTIAGAALDVTDPEPLPADDPLLSAPNLIVVPHIGSATQTTRARMADLAVDNLLAGLDGRPMPHQVNLLA